MAVSLDSGGSGRGRARWKPKAEINVTPFVDVMLVLLIVFMVTAPLLTVGVPVDLPKTEASQINNPDEPLVVTIDAERRFYIQETEVPRDRLVPRLRAITAANQDQRIFVRGDQSIAYGEVMGLMGLINAAGFDRVALIAELPEQSQ